MRYLGIDYGRKRIGIAISDPEGQMAFPAQILVNKDMKSVLMEIQSVCKKEKIGHIVIGLPLSLDGEDSLQTRSVRKFFEALHKKIELPITYENEMFTTRMVQEGTLKKKHVDASAAAIILQSYLDKKQSRSIM